MVQMLATTVVDRALQRDLEKCTSTLAPKLARSLGLVAPKTRRDYSEWQILTF